MDITKLVALRVPSGEPLSSLYSVGLAKGTRLPLILAPTTVGTDSEVTPISVVTTSGGQKKNAVPSPLLLPDLAPLDAELMLGLL
ncbi:hypothetical protein LMTR3_21650 [Bradyrhizobium sp. LMTR 3]|nr:hypothetical protein LMTR3_21650 [Bradyrhizobium sp. LMTR 3]